MANKKYRVTVYLKSKVLFEPLFVFVVSSLSEVTIKNFDYTFLVDEFCVEEADNGCI